MKTSIKPVLLMVSSIFLFLAMACTDNKPATSVVSKGKADPVELGRETFMQSCQSCHGTDGKGDIGPDLTDSVWKYGNSDDQLFESISKGRPGGMPAWENQLGEEKIRNVIAYLRSIGGK